MVMEMFWILTVLISTSLLRCYSIVLEDLTVGENLVEGTCDLCIIFTTTRGSNIPSKQKVKFKKTDPQTN